MRSRLLLALTAAAAGAVIAAAPAGAVPLPFCTGGVTTNCVVSVTRDSGTGPVAITYPSTAGDPYQVFVDRITAPGSHEDYWLFVDKMAGGWTLDYGDTWVFTINTGSTAPATTFTRGRNVTVTRGGSPGSRTVSVSAQPVRMAFDGCNSMGSCVGTATTLGPGYLETYINDLSYVTDPAYEAAQRGFDLATNADWASTPPQLDFDTNAIVLDIANSHFEPDGTTVFVGGAEFRLPNAMLSGLYNVDDPASLTASAFRVTAGTGPAPTVSVVVGTGDVNVSIQNITFSKRKLKIRGDMRPRAPRNVRAARTGVTTAIVRFDKALPRGSKVRGYRATCNSNGHVVTKSSLRAPLRLRGLRSTRYRCNIRAKSRAGLGFYRGFTIRARA
jgi:hypothetical protein